ncbi:quinone oxidoreductase [Sporosarcina sp. Marseille-Q4063]|uniref:quinone oxidoreductase family protein n=1 Tax=Sporosarcina sp. Marseille-Q4063 TaxID=2810514 RepID=UPI001BB07478|nr:quinone oxidoreductase [Sporosarcina sp. Marseille-Q4063]QUW23901.1 quinone oxidoreductase [Sporosarcina sp. Marseille-Q4063]
MKAIQFEEYGGPEVLKYMDVEIPEIGDQEVLVSVKAIGVNYADTARREGKYVVPTELPFIPGAEIAGEIVAVGKNVTHFIPGMRIVSLIESGAYAEFVKVHEMGLALIPNGVDYNDAVALPLQGQTAYHILKTMGRLEKGETVLVHAAAGGVGAISVQLAKIFGAGKVIATASSDEKLAHAEKLGADHLVNYTEEDWEQQVLQLTDGKGVDVALEMVGGDIFDKTVTCLAPFGRLVIFGAASGEQAQFYPAQLMRKNQSVIGFFLPQIVNKPELYLKSFSELLHYIDSGELELTIGGTYKLEDAAEAHRDLQGRKTMGKLVLIP